jgi:hypothetical protein
MTYSSPQIVVTHRDRTAKHGAQLVYDAMINGKAYHLADVTEDRDTGKWWLVDGLDGSATVHATLHDAVSAAQRTFNDTIRQHLAAIVGMEVRYGDKYRIEDGRTSIPWLRWVDFAKSVLDLDENYRPHLTAESEAA